MNGPVSFMLFRPPVYRAGRNYTEWQRGIPGLALPVFHEVVGRANSPMDAMVFKLQGKYHQCIGQENIIVIKYGSAKNLFIILWCGFESAERVVGVGRVRRNSPSLAPFTACTQHVDAARVGPAPTVSPRGPDAGCTKRQ